MAREKNLSHEMAREKKLKARPRESIHEIRAAGRESERKARFYSLCPAGAEEKNTRVRGKPVLFLKEKGPSSAVENRKRFSTADEGPPKIHGIFGGQRNRKKFAFFPIFSPTPKEFGENPSFF